MKFSLRDCIWASLVVLLFVELVRHERAISRNDASINGLWENAVSQEHRLFHHRQALDSIDYEVQVQLLHGHVSNLHERVAGLERELPDRQANEESRDTDGQR